METAAVIKQQKEPKPYRVYEYGITKVVGCAPGNRCKREAPACGYCWMNEQRKHRVDYWNTLVEVERGFWAEVDRICEETSDELRRVNTAIRELEGRSTALWKSGEYDAAKGLKPDLQKLWAEQAAVRKPLFKNPEVKARITAAELLRRATQKAARAAAAEAGLWWCNYDEVDEVYKAARRRFGRHLKRHHFIDERKVTVRFQQGLPVSGLFGGEGADSRLFIVPVPSNAHDQVTPRGERRRLCQTVGKLRVGSRPGTGGREARHVEFEMILHRPLPVGAVIQKASVMTEQVGSIARRKLILIVGGASVKPTPKDVHGFVGVDLGWRRMKDGRIRVGYAATGNGYQRDLYLPGAHDGVVDEKSRAAKGKAGLLGALINAEGIRRVQDEHIDEIKALLQTVVFPPEFADTPPQPRCPRCGAVLLPGQRHDPGVRTLSRWRGAWRLHRLLRFWPNHRFDGDAASLAALSAWAKKDRHLNDYEANSRDQALGHRKDLFRRWALELAKLKATIVIEKFDLRKMAVAKAEPGELQMVADAAQHIRQLAGVSVFRNILKQTAMREGIPLIEVEAKGTTVTCHNCGVVVQFDKARVVVVKCPGCGQEWDQDFNAAMNLAKRP